jgi:hypothetical protein
MPNYCAEVLVFVSVSLSPPLPLGAAWCQQKKESTARDDLTGAAMMDDYYSEIISKVCRMCFAGELPVAKDEIFIDAVMAALQRTTLAGQPQAVPDIFRDGLREALSELRLAETASSEFVN